MVAVFNDTLAGIGFHREAFRPVLGRKRTTLIPDSGKVVLLPQTLLRQGFNSWKTTMAPSSLRTYSYR